MGGGKKPVVGRPRVSKSIVTNSYFYSTRHRELNDKAIEIVGKKTDVTDSVGPLVEGEILAFLTYAQETYGLGLWDPDPVVEEDGQKYIHGVAEKTGHDTLNALVAEWREKS